MKSWSWILGFLGGLGLLAFLAYALLVDQIETPFALAGGAAALLVVAWIALDWQALAGMARARGTRYSVNAILLVLVALGIAVAGNVLAHRYDKRFDMTASKRFDLSEQTKKVLAGLDQDITILAFFPAGSAEESSLRDLLDGYEGETGRLQVSWHDPVREPLLAEQNKIESTWGTVILRAGTAPTGEAGAGGQEQRLDGEFDEEALTNALIRLTSGKKHPLCFSSGHGELDPSNSSEAAGLGLAGDKLRGLNYEIRDLSLLREGAVPADCELLVVADPQSNWLQPELEMLAAYVASGGKVMILLDPTHAPGLAQDLGRYGFELVEDIVLESNPSYQLVGGDQTFLVLDKQSLLPHPLSEDFAGMAILRVARSVSPGDPIEGIDVQVLARTTPLGWGETSLDGQTLPAPGEGDLVGNVPLIALAEVRDPNAVRVGTRSLGSQAPAVPGLAAEAPAAQVPAAQVPAAQVPVAEAPAAEVPAAEVPAAEVPAAELVRAEGGKVLVFGDSDFATNELFVQGSNQDLLLNSVAWMVGEEDQITIRPNAASTATLSMGLLEGLAVWLLCLLVVPAVAIGMALGTWRRRRAL